MWHETGGGGASSNDQRRPSIGDHYDNKGGLTRIEQFRRDKRFRLVSAADGVLVFKER